MKNKESKKYEIGNRIRKYREASHLSQKQLAEILGVSNSRVSNWEQGLNRPDADILAEMCVALDQGHGGRADRAGTESSESLSGKRGY